MCTVTTAEPEAAFRDCRSLRLQERVRGFRQDGRTLETAFTIPRPVTTATVVLEILHLNIFRCLSCNRVETISKSEGIEKIGSRLDSLETEAEIKPLLEPSFFEHRGFCKIFDLELFRH